MKLERNGLYKGCCILKEKVSLQTFIIEQIFITSVPIETKLSQEDRALLKSSLEQFCLAQTELSNLADIAVCKFQQLIKNPDKHSLYNNLAAVYSIQGAKRKAQQICITYLGKLIK